MAEDLNISLGLSREERYREIIPQIEGLISDESDLIANLGNIAAALKEAFNFLWIGFWTPDTAVQRPGWGRGVCRPGTRSRTLRGG